MLKIEKITPAKITQLAHFSSGCEILFESKSGKKTFSKYESDTRYVKIAENTEESILKSHFSCFGFFAKTIKAGAKIRNKPMIPLKVDSGITKFEVVKKLVISLFQYLFKTIPERIIRLK